MNRINIFKLIFLVILLDSMLFVQAEKLIDCSDDVIKMTYLTDDLAGEEEGDFHDEIDLISIELSDDGDNKELRLTYADTPIVSDGKRGYYGFITYIVSDILHVVAYCAGSTSSTSDSFLIVFTKEAEPLFVEDAGTIDGDSLLFSYNSSCWPDGDLSECQVVATSIYSELGYQPSWEWKEGDVFYMDIYPDNGSCELDDADNTDDIYGLSMNQALYSMLTVTVATMVIKRKRKID